MRLRLKLVTATLWAAFGIAVLASRSFGQAVPELIEVDPQRGTVALTNLATQICTSTNKIALAITITITNSVPAMVWPGTNTTLSGGYYITGNGGHITIFYPLGDIRSWRGVGIGGTSFGTFVREWRTTP